MARDGGDEVEQAGEQRSTRIESLRALAALAVLVSHVFLVSQPGGLPALTASFPRRVLLGGGVAVFLFFALTGYLLFLPWVREAFEDGRPVALGRYARNRVLRILPLYWVVVAVLLVLQHGGGSAHQWLRFLTLTQNFSSDTVATVDGPMWSLVVEVHFYLLLPGLAWGLTRLPSASRARAALALGVLAVPSAALYWVEVTHRTTAPDLRWQYSLPVTFFFFVPGMLLALLRSHLETTGARLPGVAGRADAWLVASVPVWLLAVDSFANAHVCALGAFLLLGGCVLPLRAGPLLGCLAFRPLATLGIASYSLYLWHLPLVEALWPDRARGFLALLALAGAMSLAVALVSYRVVEAPFLRMRRPMGAIARE